VPGVVVAARPGAFGVAAAPGALGAFGVATPGRWIPVLAFGGGSGVRVAVAGPGDGNVRPATGGRLAGATALGLGATFAGRTCGWTRWPGIARGGCATRGACRAMGGLAVCLTGFRLSVSADAMAVLNATKIAAMVSNRPDV
jgi:hypothetical protein